MEVNNKIQKLVRKYDQDQQRSRRSTSQSPTKAHNPQRFIVSRDDEKTRISDSIKPDKLSHEAKYLEYINWNKNALSYAEINSMNQKTQKIQVSAMYGILDDYLVNYLHVQYPDGKDVPVLLKRNVRTRLPMLRSSHRTIPEEEIEAAIKRKNDVMKKQQQRYDKTAKDLPELNVGDLVRVFNFKTRQWNLKAKIIHKNENRSNQIRTSNNVTLWRNRRFLKIIRGLTPDQTSAASCLAASSYSSKASSFTANARGR